MFITFRGLVLVVLVVLAFAPRAFSEAQAFGFGRAPTAEELEEADIDVRFDGVGLPSGQGTRKQGAATYAARCASCHGVNLEGSKELRVKPLIGEARHSVNMWPFAPPLFGYIRRSMPLHQPGSLSNAEVYGLVAFLLHKGGVTSRRGFDAQSLRRVEMPNRKNFVPRSDSGVLLMETPDGGAAQESLPSARPGEPD